MYKIGFRDMMRIVYQEASMPSKGYVLLRINDSEDERIRHIALPQGWRVRSCSPRPEAMGKGMMDGAYEPRSAGMSR